MPRREAKATPFAPGSNSRRTIKGHPLRAGVPGTPVPRLAELRSLVHHNWSEMSVSSMLRGRGVMHAGAE
jgi:hypothetical protein